MSLRRVAVAVLSALAFFAAPASATQITYTETANVTGSLNGTFFPETMLTLTATADTSSAVGLSSSYVSLFTPIHFTVSGVGSGVFTDETYLLDVQFQTTIGFYDDPSGGPAFAILGIQRSPAFGSYNLTGPIGPVTADPFLDSFYSFGYQFPTSSGNLQIDGIDTDADIIFTATVPEPSTWAMMLLGFAGLGLPAIAG
jgi:hypothetical protein